jgi:phosphohistidine phosphatase
MPFTHFFGQTMNVYMLRHAIAVERGTKHYPNDDRPLTKGGVRKMKEAAPGIRRIAGRVDVILSSPLVRAHDTAKIAAKALKYRHEILLRDELLPEASTTEILTYLRKFKESASVLLVGHEPLLGIVASALLGSETTAIEFKKGALCCISTPKLPSDTPGTLLWHLTPKQLRMLASA